MAAITSRASRLVSLVIDEDAYVRRMFLMLPSPPWEVNETPDNW